MICTQRKLCCADSTKGSSLPKSGLVGDDVDGDHKGLFGDDVESKIAV